MHSFPFRSAFSSRRCVLTKVTVCRRSCIGTPNSRMRAKTSAHDLACTVVNTICPLSAARTIMCAVSTLLTSAIMMMSGS